MGRKKSILGLVILGLFLLTMPLTHVRSAATPLPITLADTSPSTAKVIPTINKSTKTLGATTSKPQSAIRLPPIHEGLSSSTIPELQKLALFESNAGGAVASGVMLFTDYPDDVGSAKLAAKNMASRLTQIASFGITPVIVMEPTNSSGTLNFAGYSAGAYDSILSVYFQTLKTTGISDHDMGVWVYFPEANLPEWGPVDVANYASNVTHTVQIQKKYFPTGRASILLDAQSYPAGTTNWSNGSYSSLLPYISNIPAGLLDSFGLQGFPWAPPANQPSQTNYNPSVYLNTNLAAEAASALGVKNIWLNTGTFRAMYTNNKSQTVYMQPSQRQQLLNNVSQQTTSLRQKGYSVAVNLFCEDKSNVSESIDWSYKSVEEKAVLNGFSLQLNASGTSLWLFNG